MQTINTTSTTSTTDIETQLAALTRRHKRHQAMLDEHHARRIRARENHACATTIKTTP